MGVKSTIDLTRQEAEKRYVRIIVDLAAKKVRLSASQLAATWSDKQLEDVLERMNDAANDGEGFENYLIVEN